MLDDPVRGVGVSDVVRGCWLWEAPVYSDWW